MNCEFQQNDIQLLKSGNFADATVKCKGRTWKVHRSLLASRLEFFRAAFYGSFAEVASREIDFPESDPDSVYIMLRNLYREDLDVSDLTTPALCVRCWRLADYVQLETLKTVATSSLGQHLDAMTLLASSSHWENHPGVLPKWLDYLFDAVQELGRGDVTKPLSSIFAAFFWVT